MAEIPMTRGKLAEKSKVSYSHLKNLPDGRRRWNEDTKAKASKALNIVTEYKCVS
jgi:hypothetical protein